jgi:hypothetical protein
MEDLAVKVDEEGAAPNICIRELIGGRQGALRERMKCLASTVCLHWCTGNGEKDNCERYDENESKCNNASEFHVPTSSVRFR